MLKKYDTAKEQKLTPKQQRFVQEYVKYFNATQAYKRAGYAIKAHVRQNAHKLFTNPYIQEAISREKERITKEVQITQKQVLNMLIREANYNGQGSTQSARVQAITQLGRYLSMFTDNSNVNVGDLSRRMREAEKRVSEQTSEQCSEHHENTINSENSEQKPENVVNITKSA